MKTMSWEVTKELLTNAGMVEVRGGGHDFGGFPSIMEDQIEISSSTGRQYVMFYPEHNTSIKCEREKMWMTTSNGVKITLIPYFTANLEQK